MNSRVKTPLGNPMFLGVMWLLGLPKYRVSVFAVSRLDLGKLSTTRRRMARERRGAGSSLVSMETPYYKTIN